MKDHAQNYMEIFGPYGSYKFNKIRVYDIHGIQTLQSAELLSTEGLPSSCTRNSMGSFLYAHETVTNHIETKEIICAIKCKHRLREDINRKCISNGKAFLHENYTTFSCYREMIQWNDNFSFLDHYNFEDREEARKIFLAASKKSRMRSPNVEWGFAGKTF